MATGGGTAIGGGSAAGGGAATGGGTSDAGYNVMFQTSAAFPPNFDGVSGADGLCTSIGEDAGLVGPFVAFVDQQGMSPFENRLIAGHPGWVRTDGVFFAGSAPQVRSGHMYAPATVDEHGAAITAMRNADFYWMGSPTEDNCTNFTGDGGPASQGTVQTFEYVFTFESRVACSTTAHLLCFANHAGPSAAIAVPTAHRSFVSSFKVTGAVADATASMMCQAEANDAGLNGNFVVARADSTHSIAENAGFDSGFVWSRVDGAPLAASPADLAASRWLTGPLLHADGSPPDSFAIWLGAGSFTAPATMDCSDWSSSSANASWSNDLYLDLIFQNNADPCSGLYHVYCFEK
jgi:hypothetical protein